MSPAAPQRGKGAARQPLDFRLPVRGGPSGYPAVRRSSGSPREKDPANGLLKQPARTGCWRLLIFHLFNEAAETSARFPSLNTPVETVSPPFPGCGFTLSRVAGRL